MKNTAIGFVVAVGLAAGSFVGYVGYVAVRRAAVVFAFLAEPVAKAADGKDITRADVLAAQVKQAVAGASQGK